MPCLSLQLPADWQGKRLISAHNVLHLSEKELIYDEVVLLQQFLAGSEEAFTTIYKLLYQRVFWSAKKYVDTTADAQDLTAETFVQLLQHNRSFTSLDGIAAFLHVTVRNKCFNLLKHKQVKAAHHPELLRLLEEQGANDFFEERVQIELMRKIYAEVDKLPARMKEIFLLSYREGLKPAQIAEQLEIKVQTVINQRVNAVKLLQLLLQKEALLILLLLLGRQS
jgi:RNA polymerase sigma-70 factor (ECF subfamily)